jgi:hypothetical protein
VNRGTTKTESVARTTSTMINSMRVNPAKRKLAIVTLNNRQIPAAVRVFAGYAHYGVMAEKVTVCAGVVRFRVQVVTVPEAPSASAEIV